MAENAEYFPQIIDAFAAVIQEAAKSPLGLLALMILLLGILAFFFFRREKAQVKLVVFCSLLIGFLLFGYKAYNVEAYRVTEVPGKNTDLASNDKDEKKADQGVESSAPLAKESNPTVSQRTAAAASSKKIKRSPECGAQSTGWLPVGRKIPNPCPDGCKQAKELGRSFRVVGFPPKPQIKYKFQCSRQ